MTGSLVLRPGWRFDGVVLFTATRAIDREAIGARVTTWIEDHPERAVVEIVVAQSSDAAFHCLSMWLFHAPLQG